MPEITVAVLGTGLMGAPMARNILKAGFPTTVWNRSRAKAEALEVDGAQVADTAAAAVAGADFVITMLSDGPAVADLLFTQGVAAAMKPGAAVIDMSSIKPAEASDHAAKLAAMGLGHIDAPVSGGTRGAAGATLAIMAGGDAALIARAHAVLSAMGRPVRVGPVGAGQLSKLVNQTIVAVTIGVVAEAMLLAREGGADPAAIRDALKGGFADSVILQQHGARMTTGNFIPGGPSRLQVKDLDNALEVSRAANLTLPLTEQVRDRFARFVDDLDGGNKDHSGLWLELLDINKLA
jgi:2-hydroxy-3-oxopropionate reductase